MSTVGQVVDAVYRDWLRSGDDQPVVTLLSGALTASATTLTLDTAMLLPDELDLFARGVLVEVGLEQMILRSDVTAGSVTVIRGANGTTADAHSAGSLVYPQPKYGRRSVFEAVCDAVQGLWPDLFQVVARDVVIGSAYTEVPSHAQTVLEVRFFEGGTWFTTAGTLALGFPSSSTGVGLFAGITPGRGATVIFRGSFERPETENDDLQLFGVQQQWERIVALTAAAQIIMGGPELDPLTHEFVGEQLARETFPPGGAGQIARRLLDAAAQMRAEARRQLYAVHPIPVSFTPGSGTW